MDKTLIYYVFLALNFNLVEQWILSFVFIILLVLLP